MPKHMGTWNGHLNDLGLHLIKHRSNQIRHNGDYGTNVRDELNGITDAILTTASGWAPAVGSLIQLRAIPESEREDRQIRLVENRECVYRFDVQATGVDDNNSIIVPDDVPPERGAWYKIRLADDHGEMLGLGDDDHLQYIRVDGFRSFTDTVGGVYPTDPSHLATQEYVTDEKTPDINTVDTNYNVSVDDEIILAQNTITLTLPSGTIGLDYSIKNIGTGTITIDGDGYDIDGESTIELIQHESVYIVSDSNNWWIL